jgi:hypothetical protein
MCQIDSEADMLHAFDYLPAVHGQTTITLLQASIANQAAIVVGELHHPNAKAVERIDQLDICA